MIYRNGKKIGALFRNGNSVSKAFRNGKLVWQKDEPEAKWVKSITVALPQWSSGRKNRVVWESILRSLSRTTSGYFLDVTIKGIGVRLLGAGSNYEGTLGSSTSTNVKITMPSNLTITTDDVHVGQSLSFAAKLPSVTKSPSSKSSSDSYKTRAAYKFANAPFMTGSKLVITYTSASSLQIPNLTVYGNCRGDATNGKPYVAKSTTGKRSSADQTFTITYSGTDYDTIVTQSVPGDKCFACYVQAERTKSIKKAVLTSPASTPKLTLKITSIETY